MMEKLIEEGKLTPLLHTRNKKTMDTGISGLTTSLHLNGFIHSINSLHSSQGYITLTSSGQFPNDKWYESHYVRQYRKELAETKLGFGTIPDIPLENVEPYYLEGKFPCFLYEWQGAAFQSTFYPVENEGKTYLIHELKMKNNNEVELAIPLKIGGTLSLNRCSYGQLTEGGPILVPALDNQFHVKDHQVTLRNDNLEASFSAFHFYNGNPLNLSEITCQSDSPIDYCTNTEVIVPKGQTDVIMSVYTFSANDVSSEFAALMVKNALNRIGALIIQDILPHSSYIIERNVDYIISNCAVPITDEHVCVITDHQLLPLSWNRDSYYMMELLLEAAGISDLEKREKIQQIVKGHLCWMFEKAELTDGYWGRAYLTNGYCKDKIFQLDQQIYPLLELCRYYETFKDSTTIERLSPCIEKTVQMILTHKAPEKWLFKTGETPADDKVDYPYHFSSQVLFWHTLVKLEELNKIFSFTTLDLKEMAKNIKRDCLAAFTSDLDGKKVFAYLTDLHGNYQYYHDANDLPTVLAPLWNFCSDDETWINTMDFAFSEKNKGGYYTGNFKGLGSVHTPHPWPLGDGQEILYRFITNQTDGVNKVWNKLLQVVQSDGLFSEGIDEDTGAVASRHWFSWPGAFISTVVLHMLKHQTKYSIGVDIGGTKIAIAIVDKAGSIVAKDVLPTNMDRIPEKMISIIAERITILLESKQIKEESISGIGIGAPGPLDVKNGRITCPPNLPTWWDFPVISEMAKYFSLPIYLVNDANAAVLAEKWIGAAKENENFIYMTISTGIGAGIFSNGALLGGTSGNAGDIGHMVVDSSYGQCVCGQYGCIESIASGTAIAKRGSELLGEPVTTKQVFEMYEENHPLIRPFIEDVFTKIGVACVSLINILDPEVIVIGGGVSRVGNPLFLAVTSYIQKHALSPKGRNVKVIPSALSDETGVVGAAFLGIGQSGESECF